MELIAPALSNLLKKCVQDSEIIDCSISSGCNPGDNVVGKMISAKITTSSGQQNDLVVKAAVPFRTGEESELTHEEKLFARAMSKLGPFQTELAYYQGVQPGLNALIKEGYALPTPHLFFGQDDQENDGFNACLILDDLRPKGYRMADKMKGLTYEEVIMVLEKLAKFHAASYVYLQKARVDVFAKEDPLSTHSFKKTKEIKAEKVHDEFLREITSGALSIGQVMEAISENLYNRIIKMTQNSLQLIVESSQKAAEEYFHVVVHGDLWVNNILFKYDKQDKPVDASFIDFQQCRYASIFDDLHYFVHTSTTATFRKQNLDKGLDFYYETFMDTLRSLLGRQSLEDRVLNGFTKDCFYAGYRKFLGAAFCYGVMAIPFQLGIAPPTTSDESNAGSKIIPPSRSEEKNVQIPSRGVTDKLGEIEELREFFASTFKSLGVGLVRDTRNSPVAISRLREFCLEMNELGVFNT